MKQSVSQLASAFNDRFLQLLISLDEAIVLSGKKTAQMKIFEDSEQQDARRELLMVEEIANRKREIEADAEMTHHLKIEAQFHQRLLVDIEERLQDTDNILSSILNVNEHLGKLLDVLYTEACTLSKLVDHIDALPWLQRAILQFVKQPKYRRVDAKGHAVIISTTKAALSFIGIESLRQLVPVLVSKHVMPPNSEFTPDLQRHLWLYTIGTGNVARELSKEFGVKPHLGFNLGLLASIGHSVVATIYLKAFDIQLREEIIDAKNNNNHVLAQSIAKLTPSHKYIRSLWKMHAAKVAYSIIAALKLRWLNITPGVAGIASIKEISYKYVEKHNLHPLAKLLFKSAGYMQFKLMQKNQLMSKEASMLYLRNFGIAASDLSNLRNVNLTGLELKIAQNA
ncbi:HDOD domain-containing protein [Agaribacter flavus]|uniref:HDOD domain-containing protein n=1 Tax=Agaribacter flavus TaxID=1902781 RepID=A0ABV7FRJ4_9ALTE